jgi:hypothetical protein
MPHDCRPFDYISVSFARALWLRIEGCHRGFYFPDMRYLGLLSEAFRSILLEAEAATFAPMQRLNEARHSSIRH